MQTISKSRVCVGMAFFLGSLSLVPSSSWAQVGKPSSGSTLEAAKGTHSMSSGNKSVIHNNNESSPQSNGPVNGQPNAYLNQRGTLQQPSTFNTDPGNTNPGDTNPANNLGNNGNAVYPDTSNGNYPIQEPAPAGQ